MLSYGSLSRRPHPFQRISGISVTEFERLYPAFEAAWVAAEEQRLTRPNRKRAIGGGGDYGLTLENQLLLLLVWLRLYPSTEALGYFFGVSQATASRLTRRLLLVLQTVSEAEFGRFDPPVRGRERDLAQLQAEEADLFAILDATEQPLERPKEKKRERLAYSGKRRRSTCKSSLLVNERGIIRAVAPTTLGRTHDLTHFRQSQLRHYIPPGAVLLADAGYDGLVKDLPDRVVVTSFKAQRNHPLQPVHRYLNRQFSSVRSIIENVICHLKHFRALADRFRHDVDKVHTPLFAVVALLVNQRTRLRLARTAAP